MAAVMVNKMREESEKRLSRLESLMKDIFRESRVSATSGTSARLHYASQNEGWTARLRTRSSKNIAAG